MENSPKTLAHVINPSQSSPQGGQQGNIDSPSNLYSTYLTVFSTQLSHKYPDTTNLETIDTENVEQIARFALACSRVALETWNDVQGVGINKRGGVGFRRTG